MDEARRIFSDIRAANAWRGTTSVSGPGSSLKATERLRQQLPAAFARFCVRSLVDAPCGDLAWMRHLDHPLDSYVGVDIVPEIIDALRTEALPGRRFEVADIVTDRLPAADAVFCRDCLVHLPLAMGVQALKNFRASGFTHAFLTTFPGAPNIESGVGGWRMLDMTAAPFNLPQPLALLPERAPRAEDPHNAKSIGVWRLASA